MNGVVKDHGSIGRINLTISVDITRLKLLWGWRQFMAGDLQSNISVNCLDDAIAVQVA